MRGIAVVAAIGAAALAAPAGAVVITYGVQSPGSIDLFPGTQQESRLTFNGCGSDCGSLDLEPGTPQQVGATGVGWPLVGTNDGRFNGPSETFEVDWLFTINGQDVFVDQLVDFRQIGNGQFQLTANEATKTLDLGADGLLDITLLYNAVQLQPVNSSGGGGYGTRFLLHDVPDPAVPEPASWAMMIAGFGLTGAALRRRRPVAVRLA